MHFLQAISAKILDETEECWYTTTVLHATVAQQVEQLTRNEQVVRSNRISSSKQKAPSRKGGAFCVYSFTRNEALGILRISTAVTQLSRNTTRDSPSRCSRVVGMIPSASMPQM